MFKITTKRSIKLFNQELAIALSKMRTKAKILKDIQDAKEWQKIATSKAIQDYLQVRLIYLQNQLVLLKKN